MNNVISASQQNTSYAITALSNFEYTFTPNKIIVLPFLQEPLMVAADPSLCESPAQRRRPSKALAQPMCKETSVSHGKKFSELDLPRWPFSTSESKPEYESRLGPGQGIEYIP